MTPISYRLILASICLFHICEQLPAMSEPESLMAYEIHEATIVSDMLQKEIITVQVLSSELLQKLSVPMPGINFKVKLNFIL